MNDIGSQQGREGIVNVCEINSQIPTATYGPIDPIRIDHHDSTLLDRYIINGFDP